MNITIRYIVKKPNGHILKETFPLYDIERGNVMTWLNSNSVGLLCEINKSLFTGLKDKNDKEIYESDIVKFTRNKIICKCDIEEVSHGQSFCSECGTKLEDKSFETLAQIIFIRGGFCFEYFEGDSTFNWQTFIAEMYIKGIEVIGNIHENPELLEKPSDL